MIVSKVTKQRTCFVISPIGKSGSAERNRSDLIFEFLINATLSVSPFDFLVERADNIAEAGVITNQIINRIVEADLVVADLTDRNANVFYELAIRHIAQKPFVHIVADGQEIPFDNAGMRAIFIDLQDLRSVDTAKKELRSQVESQFAESPKIESPISVALNLGDLKRSGDREQVALGEILSRIDDLDRGFRRLSQDFLEREKRDRLNSSFSSFEAARQSVAAALASSVRVDASSVDPAAWEKISGTDIANTKANAVNGAGTKALMGESGRLDSKLADLLATEVLKGGRKKPFSE